MVLYVGFKFHFSEPMVPFQSEALWNLAFHSHQLELREIPIADCPVPAMFTFI